MTDPTLDWRQAFRDDDELPESASPKMKAARGRRFEKILTAMFEEADLQPRLSFRPIGEEIDGSIWLDGRTILIEAKWTSERHPASSLYQFKGKVDGKLAGTLGLFVSINGFSPDAVDALVAGKDLNVVLADGNDIRAIVDSRLSVQEALRRKLRAAGDTGTPFFPLEAIPDFTASPTGHRIVIVEGQVDADYLRTVQRLVGAPEEIKIVPAGGPSNIPALIDSILLLGRVQDVQSIVIVVDGDLDGPVLHDAVRDLRSRTETSGTGIEFLTIHPDLEVALGLAPPDVPFNRRDWLRKPSQEMIQHLLREANLTHRASRDPALRQVLQAIGDPRV